MEILSDKDKAFKFMLTEETRQLEEMRQELSFYTNQCLHEARRISADNAEIFRDHFVTQSSLQVTYINQFHAVWADFMSHFAVQSDVTKAVINGVTVKKVTP